MENIDYIDFFYDSIRESFESMFDEALTLENEASAPCCISSRGVSVIIGITGEVKGRVLLDLSLSTAMDLAVRLDPDLNNEDLVLFSIAEFCNTVSGGAITNINNKYRQKGLRLSPPSIFAGTNYKIFSPSLHALLLSYDTRFGKIDFHIGFEGV